MLLAVGKLGSLLLAVGIAAFGGDAVADPVLPAQSGVRLLLADDQLAVGACVVINGQLGRIVRLTPGGYVIQTQGQPADQAMNWARTDVTAGPCPAGPAPVAAQPIVRKPAAQPGEAQPNANDPGFAVGACVTVRGAPGRIVRLTRGGYVIQTQGQPADQAMNWARTDVTAGPCPAGPAPVAERPGNVACPAADANLGLNAQGKTFLAAIRAKLNHAASPGMDGAVTSTFKSFQVLGGRSWALADGRNFSADSTKPVFDVRANFTLCTDYRASIVLRTEVSNIECFTAPNEQTECQLAGTVNGLPAQEQTIPK